jgi:hypothetical protein
MAGKRKTKSLTLEQSVVSAHLYETPLSDDLVEEYPEEDPVVEEVIKVATPVVAKIAIPVGKFESLSTAKSLKTCKKFVGKWIELKTGKSITDTHDVIAHLRAHGLVE